MIYGYIRKSTQHQDFTHQKYEIKIYAQNHHIHIDRWLAESISSREPLSKRKLGFLLEQLKEGDILIATEISRLGRSLMEVMGILQTCLTRNCQVWTIKENYHLGQDIQSQVLAFAFGLSASIERDLISARVKSCLASKKAAGVKLGRPLGAQSQKLKLSDNAKRVKALWDTGTPKAKIARIMGVHKITVIRFIRRNGWDKSKLAV